jgi:hypothetical protein
MIVVGPVGPEMIIGRALLIALGEATCGSPD